MRAKAPGSSANLGPGFDALALSLSVFIEVEITPADSFSLESTGQGDQIPKDEHHLAAVIAKQVRGDLDCRIRVNSEIPLCRGLGSSASLALAAAAAAEAENPFAVAAQFDGHPENAAASWLGGLVSAADIHGEPIAKRLPVHDDLVVIAVVPDHELSTKEARKALPDSYSRADVVFNLSRIGLMIAAFEDPTLFHPSVFEDKIHQPYRIPLFPESAPLMEILVSAGCYGSCWSGAGSSLLGLSSRAVAPTAAQEVRTKMESLGVPGEVKMIEIDRLGLQTFPS